MKRVIISAFNGVVNVGSESILQETIRFLREDVKDVDISVLTWNEEHTRKTYGVKPVNHFSLIKQPLKILKSDFFIFGGGDLITDIDKGLFFWMSKNAFSKWSGNKMIVSAVGVRPVRTPFGRFIVRKCLERSELVSVRDSASKTILDGLGVRNVEIVGDPGILVEPCSRNLAKRILYRHGIEKNSETIGFALSNWKHLRGKWSSLKIFEPKRMLKVFSEVFDRLIDEGKQVLFIPMQIAPNSDDRNIIETIKKGMKNGEKVIAFDRLYSPSETKGVMRELDLLVSMKLHGLIFASSVYTPFIAVGYGYAPRVANFAKEISQTKYILDISRITTEELLRKIGEIMKHRRGIKKELKTSMVLLNEMAKKNFELMGSVLSVC